LFSRPIDTCWIVDIQIWIVGIRCSKRIVKVPGSPRPYRRGTLDSMPGSPMGGNVDHQRFAPRKWARLPKS